MVGLIQRRPTKFRRIGEMSRRRRLCIATLQILSFYTKSKPIHMFLFTLLYLRRIKSMQYINPTIFVRVPERNGALHCAAIYAIYSIYNPTNNGVFIKYRTQNIYQISTAYPAVICEEFSMRNG